MCFTEVTFNTQRGLKHLQYILDETNRLKPRLGQNTRVALQDTMLPGGGGLSGTIPIYVTKGTAVQINFYALHSSLRRTATTPKSSTTSDGNRFHWATGTVYPSVVDHVLARHDNGFGAGTLYQSLTDVQGY
jgi:hypothetical protein